MLHNRWYITKRFSVPNGTVSKQYIFLKLYMLHNGTVTNRQTTNGTQTLWYVTYQYITVTPTYGLDVRSAYPNLTLDMVSHNQQKFTNP